MFQSECLVAAPKRNPPVVSVTMRTLTPTRNPVRRHQYHRPSLTVSVASMAFLMAAGLQ